MDYFNNTFSNSLKGFIFVEIERKNDFDDNHATYDIVKLCYMVHIISNLNPE